MKDNKDFKRVKKGLECCSVYPAKCDECPYLEPEGASCHDLIVQSRVLLDENAVVLTNEEYQTDFSNQFNKGCKHGSKETAEKYHKAMRKVIHERDYIEGYAEIGLQEENDEIAKQFGVEIKE